MIASKEQPIYQIGQKVRVVLNQRNHTARCGEIIMMVWHYKLERYMYFIAENGKRVSKRYFADDFILIKD